MEESPSIAIDNGERKIYYELYASLEPLAEDGILLCNAQLHCAVRLLPIDRSCFSIVLG